MSGAPNFCYAFDMKLLMILSFLLSACSAPFSDTATSLIFVDQKTKELEEQAEIQRKIESLNKEREEIQKRFELEKRLTWDEINLNAKKSFEEIRPLFDQKCMNCHNVNFKLPLYGRIIGKINPVKKHQVDGLKSLEYSEGFPFKANGNPPQIALLKSIRSAFIEKTMPLKSFTSVYPSKKINGEDEQVVLNWIEPLIEKLEKYDLKYNTVDTSIPGKAQKVLELKCFRCHANGNNRGRFGGMENTTELLKGQYIDLAAIDKSKLYESMVTGEMPPSRLEALSNEDINNVRSWLELEAKKMGKM